VIWANAAELDMLGYEPQEYIGRHILDFHVDRDAIEQVLERVKRGESVRQYPSQLLCKDGSIRDVLIDTNVLWEDGEFVHTSCFTHDITNLRQAEEALRGERERLNLAMMAGIMGAWEWDIASGRVTWSEKLEEIHGLAPGTFGGTFEDYMSDVHPADRERVLERIGRSLEEGAHEIEYRIRWPDGTVRWLSARGHVVRDHSGKPARMVGICSDVTDRQRRYEGERFLADATATLAASSLDYAMTLASLARLAVPRLADWCGIDVLEDDGTVTQVALAHEDPAMVKKARKLSRRYPFDPKASHGLARVLRTGEHEFYPEITERVLREVLRDEQLIEIVRNARLRSAICVPLLARGRTLGAITLATAESGRRYDEQDLALARELASQAGLAVDNARLYSQLLKASEAKDEFLGLISHELRTPITAIYGGARVLQTRGGRLDEENKARIVSDIEVESERLSRMVENLLALARVELGHKVATEPVVARRVIQKLVSSFAQRRPGRDVEFRDEGEVAPVSAQPLYLEQVVRNLLSNADKYSPEGEPIEVRLRTVDDGVECSVLDRGPGVDPGQSELIFERFYRSERSSKSAKGAGLGLTVCKRLIEAQGGRVWARPRDGGGLEVGFSLPIYSEAAE
jgi:PAS domain S-box-containing protein